MNDAIFSILAVILISFISLVGLITLSLSSKFISKIVLFLVSLAAGTLLGDVFFHIIPEIYSHENDYTELVPFSILFGVLIFFFMEKILHWHHCHKPEEHGHSKPLAVSNLVADGLHNFIDGIIIASSFQVSVEVGISSTIAVILHEIPQEIGDFGVLIHAGLSKQRALFFNFISALLAILGAVITLIIGGMNEATNFILLGLAAGGFIYIAVGDLLPELKIEEKLSKSIYQFLIVLLGIVLMFGLTFIEPHSHSHENEDELHLDEEEHEEEEDSSEELHDE